MPGQSSSRLSVVRQWTRAHRRLLCSAALILVVLLAVLEVGVRVVTPDAMEVIEYGYTNPQRVAYDHLVTNPVEVAADYQSLTSTAAGWNTFDPRWLDLQNRGFWPCQATHLPSGLPASSTRPLILRFLWHGLPVAVAAHMPPTSGPGGIWTCAPSEWSLNAGGVPNPRPYFSVASFQWFPTPSVETPH